MLTILRTDVIEHMIQYAYAYIHREGHEFRGFELKVSEGMSASLLGCAIEDWEYRSLRQIAFNSALLSHFIVPSLRCGTLHTLSHEHHSRGNDDEINTIFPSWNYEGQLFDLLFEYYAIEIIPLTTKSYTP